jgi:glycosyltransferase involved in cell wall biosynthesis
MVPRILFIVPAYNEEENLAAVVAGVRAHYPSADILVVNDGSTDGTSAVARQSGALLLELPFNLGIGGAVQSGLLVAQRNGHDVAVQFDGDGQHTPDEIGPLLARLDKGDCDVVVGSRFVEPSAYRAPIPRRVGILILSLVHRIVLRRRISDPTSGFRAYNRAAIEFLAEEYPHDYPEPESIVTLTRNGFRVVEVKVEMKPRQGGRSSITFWRAVYYMLKVLVAIAIGATRQRRRSRPDEHRTANRESLHQPSGHPPGRTTRSPA